MKPLVGKGYLDTSALTMTRCLSFIAGRPICGFWRSMKSKRCPTFQFLIHLLNGNTPLGVTVEESVKRAELDDVRWASHCRGLVQLPMVA